jgi:cytidylate kinase
MSVITISRGSYSRGKEVAEKVAQSLGYECISRDILLEASEQFHISEMKLIRAIHDAPSILDRFTYGKERYVAYIQAALLKHVQKDNVVYHGLAGHVLLQGIPHVLKVRIIADLEDRVREEMKRENISAEKARYILKKDDDERRRWSQNLYGIDPWDSSLYDIVLHIRTISVRDAVNIILNSIKLPHFQTTPESQKTLDNLSLAAQVKAALVKDFPSVGVSAEGGGVFISISSPGKGEEIVQKVRDAAQTVDGVKKVEVNVTPPLSSAFLRSL